MAASVPVRLIGFLAKLRAMVDEEESNDVVGWSPSGETFFLIGAQRFSKEVLVQWFKHSNCASFVRQLEMYGFHRLKLPENGTDVLRFVNPNFRRDLPELVRFIQRRQLHGPGPDMNTVVHDAAAMNARRQHASLSHMARRSTKHPAHLCARCWKAAATSNSHRVFPRT
ncbi:HSF-type DNA-binding-domain-containing protein [Roridomyces roridus]|uniref:HSF-type DNA-binding-domain-containing protein n=1 Tax=Roridomyces roridus TaxID=1738132 RepID=A0AAD7FWA2_9AGAR|nr:HSF-type DNA-binding-domain-containing protein [Roridomyces roridus]